MGFCLIPRLEESREMSKYNHSPKVRQTRAWYENVGDGAKLSKEGKNSNDFKPKRKRIRRER